MTDIKTRLVATETIHFPRNTANDHSEDREVLVNPDGPDAVAYIAELEAALGRIAGNDSDGLHMHTPQAMQAIARTALTPNETGAATALQTFTDPRQPEPPNP